MQIKVAESAGFCFGVRRAIDLAQRHIETADSPPVYTLGPLIHNQAVIDSLKQEGVIPLSPDENGLLNRQQLCLIQGKTVVIRAHGIGRKVWQELKDYGANPVDATCPFVAHIQSILKEVPDEEQIIILGDASHPEVKGLIGWCNKIPYVYSSLEELEQNLPPRDYSYTLVSQSTFREDNFEKIVALLTKLEYSLHDYKTICEATRTHQNEAYALAGQSDMMFVVGSSQSANTKSLLALCQSVCPNTFLISGKEDISSQMANLARKSRLVGITAGASTPDYIIQEVVSRMSDTESFSELFEESYVKVRTGSVVSAKVVRVTESELILDLGYKCDAIMSAQEYGGDPNLPLTEQVHAGDEVEAKIIKKSDTEILLSRRQFRQNKNAAELQEALANNTVLTGNVKEVVPDKGLLVDYNGTDIFVPASKVDVRRVEDLSEFKGQDISFVLIESKNRRGRLCGDRQSVVRSEHAAKRAEALASLKEGDRTHGLVRSLTSYGAFVDLGGVDGMLHVSEMGYKGLRHPGQYVKVGQEIDVLVKSIDPETGRISLSTRFPGENPWDTAAEKYAVGNVVTGTVVRFCEFGAFVELEKDVDGLIHVSQLSNKFVQKANEVLTIGQTVEAQVIDFDLNAKRISLSLKALEEPEVLPEETAPENDSAFEPEA